MHVIDEAGDWMLCQRDDTLIATRPLPFDGAKYYSTKPRSTAPGKTSEYGLTVEDVIDRYLRHSPRTATRARLASLVEDDQ